MARLGQTIVGFRQLTNKLEGGAAKRRIIARWIPGIIPGRKPETKKVRARKANAFLDTLRPARRVIFEHVLEEIRTNPSASSTSAVDLGVIVSRKLRKTNPRIQVTPDMIMHLICAAKKAGAIKTK